MRRQHATKNKRTHTPSGDWLAVGRLLGTKGLDASYDLVLTAETIYSQEGSLRLLECIKQVCVLCCVS